MPDKLSDFPSIPQARCPHCYYRLSRVGQVNTRAADTPTPRPGDLTVCVGCGAALQFGPKLRLLPLAARELAALEPDERADLQATQAHVRAAIARNFKPPS